MQDSEIVTKNKTNHSVKRINIESLIINEKSSYSIAENLNPNSSKLTNFGHLISPLNHRDKLNFLDPTPKSRINHNSFSPFNRKSSQDSDCDKPLNTKDTSANISRHNFNHQDLGDKGNPKPFNLTANTENDLDSSSSGGAEVNTARAFVKNGSVRKIHLTDFCKVKRK